MCYAPQKMKFPQEVLMLKLLRTRGGDKVYAMRVYPCERNVPSHFRAARIAPGVTYTIVNGVDS